MRNQFLEYTNDPIKAHDLKVAWDKVFKKNEGNKDVKAVLDHLAWFCKVSRTNYSKQPHDIIYSAGMQNVYHFIMDCVNVEITMKEESKNV